MSERRLRMEVAGFAFVAGAHLMAAVISGNLVLWFAAVLFSAITVAGLFAPERES